MFAWKLIAWTIGYQTQERREPCAPEETRRNESGYQSFPELEEVGPGRGYEAGEAEEGNGGEEGGFECGKE